MQSGSVIDFKGEKCIVERFLAEGGFAKVYLVQYRNSLHVLKHITCQDRVSLQHLIKEAEIHRMVSGHPFIVTFEDYFYQASNCGFQLMILMEYCEGGHLVDYLNSRIDRRPSESEILNIFSQIIKAVAHLHSFNPSIIHRDVKIENVLLSKGVFKLCDFGSCTTQKVSKEIFLSLQEIKILEEEINSFTTLQYRSPEMCDLYLKRGLNEKSDLWALGVVLYKICYYTTPFETSGKMAILNGKFEIPFLPIYSNDLKTLIHSLLQVDTSRRPDIFQLYDRVCHMQRVPYDLKVQPKQFQNQAIVTASSPFRAIERVKSDFDPVQIVAPLRRFQPSSDAPPIQSSRFNDTNLPIDQRDRLPSGPMINRPPPPKPVSNAIPPPAKPPRKNRVIQIKMQPPRHEQPTASSRVSSLVSKFNES